MTDAWFHGVPSLSEAETEQAVLLCRAWDFLDRQSPPDLTWVPEHPGLARFIVYAVNTRLATVRLRDDGWFVWPYGAGEHALCSSLREVLTAVRAIQAVAC